VFEQSAPEVWKIVRDFNNDPVGVGGAGESGIEDGKSGDIAGRSGACFIGTGAFGSGCFDDDAGRRIAAQHVGPAHGVPGNRVRAAWRPFAARFGLIYPQYLRISGYSANSKIARGLLHSRAAFGIARRVAGE
jgi:hypothetical protein